MIGKRDVLAISCLEENKCIQWFLWYLTRIPQLREIIIDLCRRVGRVDASVAVTQSDAILRVLTVAHNSLKTLHQFDLTVE